MIICTKCGETLPDGTTFCTSCGTGTSQASTFESNETPGMNTNTTSNTNLPAVVSEDNIDFGDAFINFFKKAFNFTDKISKKEFWFGALTYLICLVVISIIHKIPVVKYTGWAFSIAAGFCFVSLTIKRLRDIGFPWPRIFMYLIPIYGIIRLILDMLMPSNSYKG